MLRTGPTAPGPWSFIKCPGVIYPGPWPVARGPVAVSCYLVAVSCYLVVRELRARPAGRDPYFAGYYPRTRARPWPLSLNLMNRD